MCFEPGSHRLLSSSATVEPLLARLYLSLAGPSFDTLIYFSLFDLKCMPVQFLETDEIDEKVEVAPPFMLVMLQLILPV
jgi:hypothetical protein